MNLIGQMWTTTFKQRIVVHAAFNMHCLVDNQAHSVYSQLGLNGMPFLLAAVMRFPLKLVLWPGDLLLCCIQKSFELWKEK